MRRTAHFSDKLQGRLADLVVGGWRIEIVEHSNISAHTVTVDQEACTEQLKIAEVLIAHRKDLLVPPAGFEPATKRLEGSCSIP